MRKIHFGLFLAEIICVPAFLFEFYRALSGNLLSWAYVVEWPLLGGYAVYMWYKLLKEERRGPRPAPTLASQTAAEADDPELRAWNAYLASIHSTAPEDENRRD